MSTIPPVVVYLADALGVISTPNRELSEVRFYGTKKHLAAYCTDGEMLARVIVKADFASFGQRAVSAACAAKRLDWRRTKRGLLAATLGLDATEPALLLSAPLERPTRAQFDKQFDSALKDSAKGLWGGRPMRKAFEVVEQLSAAVRLVGNRDAKSPILWTQKDLAIDVTPRTFYADLDIVVMPRSAP